MVTLEPRIDCIRMELNNGLDKNKGDREARTTCAAPPAATSGLR